MRQGALTLLAVTLSLGWAASVGPADEGSSPTTTTLPTTTTSPEEPSLGAGTPIQTSSVVLYPAYLPTAWAPDEGLSVDDALAATGVELPIRSARKLPSHPDPVTGGALILTTTGSSLRSQFAPAALLGVLIAWATLTVFEFRRDDESSERANARPIDG